MGRVAGFGGGFAEKFAEVVASGIEALDFEGIAKAILRGLCFENANDERWFAVAAGNGFQERPGEVLILDDDWKTDPLGGRVGGVANPRQDEK